jgi:transposase
MRVGANARQHAQIKKLHAQGVPAHIIATKFGMTSQSLEKILAHLDERDEVILAVEKSPEMKAMASQNKELLERLAKYEDVEVEGAPKEEPEGEPEEE